MADVASPMMVTDYLVWLSKTVNLKLELVVKGSRPHLFTPGSHTSGNCTPGTCTSGSSTPLHAGELHTFTRQAAKAG
ncbi:hypothetical protein Droror1_Dr00018403 [Drosera rotundifolia]